MSHTPEQAKELWCPMVRLAGCRPSGEVDPGQTVVNRLQIDINSGASIPDSANCIAEKCAMWRWAPQEDDEIRGYCGIAGRPEVMR